jgi:hypothetical protein
VAKPVAKKRRKPAHGKIDRRTKAFRAAKSGALPFPPADNSPSALDVALNVYSRIGALLSVLASSERRVLLERLLKEEGG